MSNEKFTLTDIDEVVHTGKDIVHILNSFFSDIVTALKINEYGDDSILNNISDPI